jgi:hypothetical protein
VTIKKLENTGIKRIFRIHNYLLFRAEIDA